MMIKSSISVIRFAIAKSTRSYKWYGTHTCRFLAGDKIICRDIQFIYATCGLHTCSEKETTSYVWLRRASSPYWWYISGLDEAEMRLMWRTFPCHTVYFEVIKESAGVNYWAGAGVLCRCTSIYPANITENADKNAWCTCRLTNVLISRFLIVIWQLITVIAIDNWTLLYQLISGFAACISTDNNAAKTIMTVQW